MTNPLSLSSPARLAAAGLVAALVASGASAQHAPPSFEAPLRYDSGPVENTGARTAVVISKTIHVEGAEWLQLFFRHVNLAGDPGQGTGSILRITSFEDGAIQEMNSIHVGQWENRSAYFNGDTVQIDVQALPGTGVNRVILASATAGLPDLAKSQCGSQDNRVASNDVRAARALPIGCSAWLLDDCAHCFGTAGHCSSSSLQTIQFNVPLSNSNGSLNHPPPQDQYSVDVSSKHAVNGGVGNDWGYFGVHPNSNTGLTAFQSQGDAYTLVVPPPFNGSQNIRITGYGVDSGTANQTQQTHAGPWVSASGTHLEYQADTTGGNSGSPVIHEPTGNVIGVHTHAGCNTSTGAGNNGTGFDNAGWQNAMNNPKGVCAASAPTTYCTAKLNSQFCVPTMTSTGTATTTGGAGSFTISSSQQLNQTSGLLFYGFGPNGVPFQGGFLCVAPPTTRTSGQNSGGNFGAPDCSGSFGFDFGLEIASGNDPNLVGGATVYAQWWSRDTGFVAPNNTNLTMGLEFTICD